MKKTGFYYLSVAFIVLAFVLGISFMLSYKTVDSEALAKALKYPSLYGADSAARPNWALGLAVCGVFAFFSAVCFAINTAMCKLDALIVPPTASPAVSPRAASAQGSSASASAPEPSFQKIGDVPSLSDVKAATSAAQALEMLDGLNLQGEPSLESFRQELIRLKGVERMYDIDHTAIQNLIEKYI